MSTIAPEAPYSPKELALPGNGQLWRMSIETYHDLIDAGTFGPDEKIELIHGYIIKKMPKNPLHAKVNQWLLIYFSQLINIQQGWYIAVQDPITLADSEPEPDLMVVRGTPGDHEGHPGPQDVALVLEVSDSSIDYDKTIKSQLYAANNIPTYWIVDVTKKEIQVYTEPYQTEEQGRYRQQSSYVVGDTVPVVLDGREYGRILVSDIFS